MTQNSPSILGNRLECRLVLPNVGEDGTLMGRSAHGESDGFMSSLPRGSLPEISCSPKTPSSSWALSHTQWSRRSSSRRTDCCAASRLLLQLHGGRQPLPCLRPDCLTCCLLMALFLLVLPSAVGGTKWDAVTQLIGAGLHSRQRLSWPGGSPVSSQCSQS